MELKNWYFIWITDGTRQARAVSADSTPKDLVDYPLPVRLDLRVSLDGEEISWDEPFRSTKIHDGSELRIEVRPRSIRMGPPRDVPLYGCPNARNTPGIVPDSMAAEFQGFSDSEV